MQKKANQIIDTNEHNPQIQLSAISELHKLNITLSNYIEVLPTVINNNGTTSISTTPEDKTARTEDRRINYYSLDLDILRDKPFWIWDKAEHLRLAKETNQTMLFQSHMQMSN